jgi:hypothetical protein
LENFIYLLGKKRKIEWNNFILLKQLK